jgi:hypothetical protein
MHIVIELSLTRTPNVRSLLLLAANARDAMPGGGELSMKARQETVHQPHPLGLSQGKPCGAAPRERKAAKAGGGRPIELLEAE